MIGYAINQHSQPKFSLTKLSNISLVRIYTHLSEVVQKGNFLTNIKRTGIKNYVKHFCRTSMWITRNLCNVFSQSCETMKYMVFSITTEDIKIRTDISL